MFENRKILLTLSWSTILLNAQFQRCLAVISVLCAAAPMFICSSASLRIDCFFLLISSITSSTFVAGPVAELASFAAAIIMAVASPPMLGCEGCGWDWASSYLPLEDENKKSVKIHELPMFISIDILWFVFFFGSYASSCSSLKVHAEFQLNNLSQIRITQCEWTSSKTNKLNSTNE